MSMQMCTVGLRSQKATVTINLSRDVSIFSQVQPSSSVLEVALEQRRFSVRKDTESHESRVSLEPGCFAVVFQLVAGLAQKQLIERLQMPSVWFRFILSPEALHGPV